MFLDIYLIFFVNIYIKVITFYQIIKTLMNLKIMNFQQEMLLKLFFTKQAPEKV
jgi:hypothetical protein